MAIKRFHPAICAAQLHWVHREFYLSSKQGGKIAFPVLWKSKPVALKRESLLNTSADGGLTIVDIITKI